MAFFLFFFIFFFYLGCGRSFYLGLSRVFPLEEFMGSKQMREKEKTTVEGERI